MANSKPILFSAAMVAAIIEGRKTQTRRTMKVQMPENFWRIGGIDTAGVNAYAVPLADDEKDDHLVQECKFPYGNIGDLLWVREEHYRFGHWRPVVGAVTKKGKKQKWEFVASTEEVRYYDDPPASFKKSRDRSNPPDTPQWYKRLARFMPRSSCRIFLEITDIRVERLNDITESDSKAEGAMFAYAGNNANSYTAGFKNIWVKINGSESWYENPWVWVIHFKVVEIKGQSRAA